MFPLGMAEIQIAELVAQGMYEGYLQAKKAYKVIKLLRKMQKLSGNAARALEDTVDQQGGISAVEITIRVEMN